MKICMQPQYPTQQIWYSGSCGTEVTRPAVTEGRMLAAAVR